MRKRIAKLCAVFATIGLVFTGCGPKATSTTPTTEEPTTPEEKYEAIDNELISKNTYKGVLFNNPISSEALCADPTAIEYEGRLYVFGTNDQQELDKKGLASENTYEAIKTLVIYSTDDMVNWTNHGVIDVGTIAPWIKSSWAPSIVSRVEDDGLTHFYLYFSNNGTGVGVITATDILGEWSDPLGHSLISSRTPGLKNCPIPFDPGVVIDDKGDAYLAFGGGGKGYISNASKIVKLGADMISLDSDISDIPAPYFFEASELNYINGTFVYTYNSDWENHAAQWDYECAVPSTCSMVYMTSTDPLNSDSWVMRGEYFKNPGLSGFDYSNNHTHVHKYQGKYYIFHHTQTMQAAMGVTGGGYRSLAVDVLDVDEDAITFKRTGASRKGVDAIKDVDAYTSNLAATMHSSADITVVADNKTKPVVTADVDGAWVSIKNVSFTDGAAKFNAELSGNGALEIRLDSPTGDFLGAVRVSSDSSVTVSTTELASISGKHDLYFVMTKEGVGFSAWSFEK